MLEIIDTLRGAQVIIECSRRENDYERPHSSFGDLASLENISKLIEGNP